MIVHDFLETQELAEVELVEVAEFDQRVGLRARFNGCFDRGPDTTEDAAALGQDAVGPEPEEEDDQ